MTDITNLEAWAMGAWHTSPYDPNATYGSGTDPLEEGYVSPHFRQSEFACNHCGEIHPTNPTPPAVVLDWLEDIRAHFGGPVNVNSGYRCPTHNKNVGGAPNSYHVQGQAVDFWLPHVSPSVIHEYVVKLVGDAGGVGKYDTFTHIDNRGYKARW